MNKNPGYDAIIIGAGIGGLVCGCYLAKAGLKTLIIEKNPVPGGYCTSFTRNGFTFDACVQFLGSLRHGGIIDSVMEDLGLKNRLKISRQSVTDLVFTKDHDLVYIYPDTNKTIDRLSSKFLSEAKNLKAFFDFIGNISGIELASLKRITFQNLLDRYFVNSKIKTILAFLVWGNLGLPPEKASAFSAVTVYKEFILDGGYYPVNGMQSFPDLLKHRFEELGGNILFSNIVKSVNINVDKADGVILNDGNKINAKFVVADTNIFQLIDKQYISEKLSDKIDKEIPSISCFIAYLGLNKNFSYSMSKDMVIWYIDEFNLENIYENTIKWSLENIDSYFARVNRKENTITAFLPAPFKSEEYWKENKEKVLNAFLYKLGSVFPEIEKNVIFKDAATPSTLKKWTMNYQGSCFGWAQTPTQIADEELSRISNIKNLFLTGHWTTFGQGIPGVTLLGKNIAKALIAKVRK